LIDFAIVAVMEKGAVMIETGAAYSLWWPVNVDHYEFVFIFAARPAP